MTPRPDHFSPSAWSTWGQCPRKWKFRYLDQIPDVGTIDTVHGRIVHRALEWFMMHDPMTRTTDAKDTMLVAALDEHEEEMTAIGVVGELRDLVEKWAKESLLGSSGIEPTAPSRTKVLATEARHEFTVAGVPIVIIVDRVDLRDDGTCVVIDYKGLALDTVLVTPTGWTTMAEVQPGDQVFDSAGQPTTVTYKSEVHWNPTYRVQFDDESTLIADHEHRWIVNMGAKQQEMTTLELAGAVARRKVSNGRPSPAVAVTEPLVTAEVELAVHPYLLGLWLADGTRGRSILSLGSTKLAAVEHLRGLGYDVRQPEWSQRETEAGADRCSFVIRGLQPAMKAIGMTGDKHIPVAYMRASVGQRLELLRGLMDGDGSYNATRKQSLINTTNKAMAIQIRELVLSLGWRACLNEYQAHGFDKWTTAYLVAWRPWRFNPFSQRTDKEHLPLKAWPRATQRYVHSVELIDTVPTQCIGVDSPTSSYLAGETMIPTHNCGKNVKVHPYQRQMVLSAMAAEEITGLECTRAELRFVRMGETKVIKVGWKAREGVEEDLQRAWRVITAACLEDEFPTITSPLCCWCAYVGICPQGLAVAQRRRRAGQSLGESAKVALGVA